MSRDAAKVVPLSQGASISCSVSKGWSVSRSVGFSAANDDGLSRSRVLFSDSRRYSPLGSYRVVPASGAQTGGTLFGPDRLVELTGAPTVSERLEFEFDVGADDSLIDRITLEPIGGEPFVVASISPSLDGLPLPVEACAYIWRGLLCSLDGPARAGSPLCGEEAAWRGWVDLMDDALSRRPGGAPPRGWTMTTPGRSGRVRLQRLARKMTGRDLAEELEYFEKSLDFLVDCVGLLASLIDVDDAGPISFAELIKWWPNAAGLVPVLARHLPAYL